MYDSRTLDAVKCYGWCRNIFKRRKVTDWKIISVFRHKIYNSQRSVWEEDERKNVTNWCQFDHIKWILLDIFCQPTRPFIPLTKVTKELLVLASSPLSTKTHKLHWFYVIWAPERRNHTQAALWNGDFRNFFYGNCICCVEPEIVRSNGSLFRI